MNRIIFLLYSLTITPITFALQPIRIEVFSGPEAKKYIEEIAQMRIILFKEFPYLYQGTIADEEKYLETYFNSPDATIILIFNNEKVVGLSSSIPLTRESAEIQQPFLQQNFALHQYLYWGSTIIY